MYDNDITLLAVGDIILDTADPDFIFKKVASLLKSADIALGQAEFPFTARGVFTAPRSASTDMFFQPCDPNNIHTVVEAGFNVITFASNHTWDSGVPGIQDTISGFKKYNIPVLGAGMNIDEARLPVIVERKGTKFGFLNYNCVGPRETYATPDKPGCAYVHILTHYELDYANPGGPSTIYTFAEPNSLAAMEEDIRKLRPLCDVLVVSLHKGIAYLPIQLAMYDKQVSYAAIDAGADLIIGHHAHILKGIEVYKGKIIFHNLGGFAMKARTHGKLPDWLQQQRNARNEELLGIEYDPVDHHRQTKLTVIAKILINNKKISHISYLPCKVSEEEQPEILRNDKRGKEVFDYMEKITGKARLNVHYSWDGNEVVISSK